MGKIKYTAELKLEIIKKVLEDNLTYTQVAKEYCVDKSDVQKWVTTYENNGIQGIYRKKVSYTGEFKLSVVEDMHKNNLSMRATAAKHNLPNHGALSRWEHIYLEKGPNELCTREPGPRTGRPRKIKEKEDLIEENQRLRMQVDYLKKLFALVQQMPKQNKKHKS